MNNHDSGPLLSAIELFYKWEKELSDHAILKQPYGDTWKTITWKEAGQEARRMATALHAMGLSNGAHVAISSKNCYHWVLADLAIMMAGSVSVPLYPSLTADQLTVVLDKSDSQAIFLGKLEKWGPERDAVLDKLQVIRFPQYPASEKVTIGASWDDLVANHAPMEASPIPDLDSIWTIIFTSGTTGTPKGVVHNHRNVARLVASEKMYDNLDAFSVPPGNNRFFSFLPLNHIAERAAVEMGAIQSGGSISFAESLDTFAKNLQETMPTFFFAVPRIWTKFMLGVLGKMPQKKLDRLLSIPIVSSMVKKKIQKGLGLSESRCCLTGASITPESTKQWYRKIGINLREVYGMTENMGGFSIMPRDEYMPNSVGKPMQDMELKIAEDTGEILMKLPWMMQSYYKEPELTEATLKDGWLHTGDKGKVDNGFLKIIGRVKDTFKTSKGEFVVPTAIEDHFSENKYIEQICVAGLGCPQPMALVCLSEIGHEAPQDKVSANLEEERCRINGLLGAHERISTIVVAKEEWNEYNKMLTPTLKIRRGAINENYGERLMKWHENQSSVIWE